MNYAALLLCGFAVAATVAAEKEKEHRCVCKVEGHGKAPSKETGVTDVEEQAREWNQLYQKEYCQNGYCYGRWCRKAVITSTGPLGTAGLKFRDCIDPPTDVKEGITQTCTSSQGSEEGALTNQKTCYCRGQDDCNE